MEKREEKLVVLIMTNEEKEVYKRISDKMKVFESTPLDNYLEKMKIIEEIQEEFKQLEEIENE